MVDCTYVMSHNNPARSWKFADFLLLFNDFLNMDHNLIMFPEVVVRSYCTLFEIFYIIQYRELNLDKEIKKPETCFIWQQTTFSPLHFIRK